jgi:hypothetical protein
MPQGILDTSCGNAACLRDATRVLGANARDDIVTMLASDPTCGELIKKGGGIRKLRVGIEGRGKRGGGRVIYFYHDGTLPIFALAFFAKNERADLSDKERNALAAFVKNLVKTYGARR